MGQFVVAHLRDRIPGGVVTRWWDAAPAASEHFCDRYPDLTAAGVPPAEWQPGDITHLAETAHPSAVPEALELAARLHCPVVLASVGGLATDEGMAAYDLAREAGVQVRIPSGAIGGLDLLRALPKAALTEVTLITRKPPAAFPDRDLGMNVAMRLFNGPAREAIRQYPKNINVAVTLSLAGMGLDTTLVEIWADPAVTQNTHEVRIRSSLGDYQVRCANVPLPDNPATSALAAWSVLAALEEHLP